MHVTHVASHSTALPCNCLLARPTTSAEHPLLYSACYLHQPPQEEGGAAGYTGLVSSDRIASTEKEGLHRTPESFPGVFDLTWYDPSTLMCCCTDGSVRLLDPDTLEERQVYRSIHTEMLTSATPIDATTLLCTAHTGGVVLYNTERAAVTSTLEGHEFDAWCSAVTGDEGIVCSGGDDGLVKYYDTRSGTATGKIRFSAGVTSIAPVMEGGTSTPYQLVGSYDETVSLVDRRAPRRPVAQTAALGGGAWRCRTAVGKEEVPPSTVGTEGWLILPLMQRGPAILPYNVKGEESSVFDACTYFCAEEPNGDLPLLSEECLVYDMTVLQSDGGNRLLVASCSFYEKKIDLWEVTKTE